ncbi:SYC2L protein, partial [Origma solitaria]|nr:SYC2L protein [Origma solitaria]
SSYRKRLFSESNNENTSSDQSEKSWILDFQTRFVQKSVDYTRKKPRVRSKLKVLPVSSASGGSDYESKKQEESRQGAQKEMPSRKSTFSSKEDDLPIVDLTGEMASEEPGGSPLLLNVPTRSYSSDVEQATQKSHGIPGKLSREEGSTKRKDSDMLSDTIVKKLKFSTSEKNHSPSETNYTPNKIFDSTKEEAEIQKGKEMDSVDVSFAKMPHEDQSDSEMVAAFESSVGQLKKLLWSRYKKLEISIQNVMRCSQKALSDLLYQIHEC